MKNKFHWITFFYWILSSLMIVWLTFAFSKGIYDFPSVGGFLVPFMTIFMIFMGWLHHREYIKEKEKLFIDNLTEEEKINYTRYKKLKKIMTDMKWKKLIFYN